MANPQHEKPNLVAEHLARGDATGWFDVVYSNAAGNADRVPWARSEARPTLKKWLEQQPKSDEAIKRALVVGCGLGDDAEILAAHGYSVTAFDISATAIEWSRRRFPNSKVDYVVGDLLNPDPNWIGAFDLVVEVYNIQALPAELRRRAGASVALTVAPAGTLLVICVGMEVRGERSGPPWPFTPTELHYFETNGLQQIHFRDVAGSGFGSRIWQVEYQREEE